MSNSEEQNDAKTTSQTKKRTSAKKATASNSKSTAGEPSTPQSTASAGAASGRVAMSAAQRRLEEMGMIDSGEQKSAASVPSNRGFRIMVVLTLVLFVVAVFFIRSNSHRQVTDEVAAQTGQEQQVDLPAPAGVSDETMADSSTADGDVYGPAQMEPPVAPTPGMMNEGGGMGYGHPGMQPPIPPMGETMMPPVDMSAYPHSMGPAFPAGQPMQPMMGYGYGPSGPYYWFIVPIPQYPGNRGGVPANPSGAAPPAPNGYEPPSAYFPSPETAPPEIDEEVITQPY